MFAMGQSSLDDVVRDVKKAIADVRASAEKSAATFEEREAYLRQTLLALREGSLQPEVAQERARRARRTQNEAPPPRNRVGMRIEQAASTTRAAPPTYMGATPTLVRASIDKACQRLDSRLCDLVCQVSGDDEEPVMAVELALLLQARSVLKNHHSELPGDVVLLDSVSEYAREVDQLIQKLAASPFERAKSMLGFIRQCLAQVRALGMAPADLKDRVKSLAKSLRDPPPETWFDDLAVVAHDVLAALDREEGTLSPLGRLARELRQPR